MKLIKFAVVQERSHQVAKGSRWGGVVIYEKHFECAAGAVNISSHIYIANHRDTKPRMGGRCRRSVLSRFLEG
jgi:hypothetical protein